MAVAGTKMMAVADTEMMAVADTEMMAFLRAYVRNYSDYATQNNPHDDNYHDICFSTAMTLYKILRTPEEEEAVTTETMLSRLEENVVILGSIAGKGQCHMFVAIPWKDTVVVVQSLGRVFAASVRTFSRGQYSSLMRDYASRPAALQLFDYYDKGSTTIAFDISQRRGMSVDILPDLEDARDRIERLRADFLEADAVSYGPDDLVRLSSYGARALNDGMYAIDFGALLSRRPDAYDVISKMTFCATTLHALQPAPPFGRPAVAAALRGTASACTCTAAF
jgi:hypothetical protein